MSIVALKCPQCHGDLQLESTREFGFCQYCGTKIMIQQEMVNIINNMSSGTTVQNHYSGETVINNYTVNKSNSGQYIFPILEEGRYEGPMQNGKPHGKGVFFWPGGVRYEGNFVNGVIEGFGKKTYSDGYYEGNFVNNLREGNGAFYSNNGWKYEGEYKQDKFNGYGTYTYGNGQTYTGNFKDGKFNGEGVMSWPSGAVYRGSWLNDNRHGKGVMKYDDGGTYSGDWVNGNCHGIGEYHEPGYAYYGEWKDDTYDGEGIQVWTAKSKTNSIKYEGHFSKGTREGLGKFYYASGSWRIGILKGDKWTDPSYFCSPFGFKVKENYNNYGKWIKDSRLFSAPSYGYEIQFKRINKIDLKP